MNEALLSIGCRLVIGHRGNAMHAPENTLPSIEQAIAAGADAVEIDVQITADGEAVVIHDASVDRTTNGSGLVSAHSLDQLRGLDAGARFSCEEGRTNPYRGTGITIPTLAEVLHSFSTTPFVIELKTAAAQPRVLQIIRDLNAGGRTVLASFDSRAVDRLRESGLRTGASRPELWSLLMRAALGMTPGRNEFDAVFMPRRFRGIPLPPEPLVRAGRRRSFPIHVWVENDERSARRLWDAGVCGIVTDDPRTIVTARG